MYTAAIECVCGKGPSLGLKKILYEWELFQDDVHGVPAVLIGWF